MFALMQLFFVVQFQMKLAEHVRGIEYDPALIMKQKKGFAGFPWNVVTFPVSEGTVFQNNILRPGFFRVHR